MATSLVTGLKPTFIPFGGPAPEVGAPVGSVAGLLYLVPNPPDHGYMEMYGLPAWDTTTCVPAAFMLMPAPKPATFDPLEYLLPKPPDHAQACGALLGDAMLMVKNASVAGVQVWPDVPAPVGDNALDGLPYLVPNPDDDHGQTWTNAPVVLLKLNSELSLVKDTRDASLVSALIDAVVLKIVPNPDASDQGYADTRRPTIAVE